MASGGDDPQAPDEETWACSHVYASRKVIGTAESETPRRNWTIREIDTRAVPGARAARCLIFENHEVVRRLWSYPATWLTLSDMRLLRLVGASP